MSVDPYTIYDFVDSHWIKKSRSKEISYWEELAYQTSLAMDSHILTAYPPLCKELSEFGPLRWNPAVIGGEELNPDLVYYGNNSNLGFGFCDYSRRPNAKFNDNLFLRIRKAVKRMSRFAQKQKLLRDIVSGYVSKKLEHPEEAMNNHRGMGQLKCNNRTYQVVAIFERFEGYSWKIEWPESQTTISFVLNV